MSELQNICKTFKTATTGCMVINREEVVSSYVEELGAVYEQCIDGNTFGDRGTIMAIEKLALIQPIEMQLVNSVTEGTIMATTVDNIDVVIEAQIRLQEKIDEVSGLEEIIKEAYEATADVEVDLNSARLTSCLECFVKDIREARGTEKKQEIVESTLESYNQSLRAYSNSYGTLTSELDELFIGIRNEIVKEGNVNHGVGKVLHSDEVSILTGLMEASKAIPKTKVEKRSFMQLASDAGDYFVAGDVILSAMGHFHKTIGVAIKKKMIKTDKQKAKTIALIEKYKRTAGRQKDISQPLRGVHPAFLLGNSVQSKTVRDLDKQLEIVKKMKVVKESIGTVNAAMVDSTGMTKCKLYKQRVNLADTNDFAKLLTTARNSAKDARIRSEMTAYSNECMSKHFQNKTLKACSLTPSEKKFYSGIKVTLEAMMGGNMTQPIQPGIPAQEPRENSSFYRSNVMEALQQNSIAAAIEQMNGLR